MVTSRFVVVVGAAVVVVVVVVVVMGTEVGATVGAGLLTAAWISGSGSGEVKRPTAKAATRATTAAARPATKRGHRRRASIAVTRKWMASSLASRSPSRE